MLPSAVLTQPCGDFAAERAQANERAEADVDDSAGMSLCQRRCEGCAGVTGAG